MHATLRPCRALLAAALAAAALCACDDTPNQLTLNPVTVGHVTGIRFTVTGGTIYQAEPDGPLYADASGGQLVLDDDPATLGMSDPDLLRLGTLFALSDGGSIQIGAFGEPGSEVSTGVWVLLSRTGSQISYDFRLSGALFANSAFAPPPAVPSGEQWVFTEFYADSVPAHGPGQSGITMWPLNDVTGAPGADVLKCDPGPAIDATPLSGDRVSYSLQRAWLLVVEVEDVIAGPCT